jgi:iron complex transport system ATP-binding protein
LKLKIDNLRTEYLDNICFELQNEPLIILGSNGAGKTTLAKALVNLLENKSVSIDGRAVYKLNAKERAQFLNYVPSKLEVFDEYLSTKEYLELCLLNGAHYEDIESVMGTLEIGYLKNQSCKSLSSGESQLLLFASALLQKAHYTIFDEPTANLDSDKKIKIFNVLKQTPEHFHIIITHDLNLAHHLGYRTLFLEKGKLLFDGSSKDFFETKNLERFFGNSIKKVVDGDQNFYRVNF